MTMAHLTKVVAENSRIRKMVYAERAQSIADAQLELAKNIVNGAIYASNKNTAIQAAVAATPPFVPGTAVEVSRVGASDSEW